MQQQYAVMLLVASILFAGITIFALCLLEPKHQPKTPTSQPGNANRKYGLDAYDALAGLPIRRRSGGSVLPATVVRRRSLQDNGTKDVSIESSAKLHSLDRMGSSIVGQVSGNAHLSNQRLIDACQTYHSPLCAASVMYAACMLESDDRNDQLCRESLQSMVDGQTSKAVSPIVEQWSGEDANMPSTSSDINLPNDRSMNMDRMMSFVDEQDPEQEGSGEITAFDPSFESSDEQISVNLDRMPTKDQQLEQELRTMSGFGAVDPDDGKPLSGPVDVASAKEKAQLASLKPGFLVDTMYPTHSLPRTDVLNAAPAQPPARQR